MYHPASSLGVTAKSYTETSCSRSPQKANILLVVQQLDLAQTPNDMRVIPFIDFRIILRVSERVRISLRDKTLPVSNMIR